MEPFSSLAGAGLVGGFVQWAGNSFYKHKILNQNEEHNCQKRLDAIEDKFEEANHKRILEAEARLVEKETESLRRIADREERQGLLDQLKELKGTISKLEEYISKLETTIQDLNCKMDANKDKAGLTTTVVTSSTSVTQATVPSSGVGSSVPSSLPPAPLDTPDSQANPSSL